jgi:hypothetical protein
VNHGIAAFSMHWQMATGIMLHRLTASTHLQVAPPPGHLADWLANVVKIGPATRNFIVCSAGRSGLSGPRLQWQARIIWFSCRRGLPWFVAPFGRDSLIVSLQNTLVYPGCARNIGGSRRALQAKEQDDYRMPSPARYCTKCDMANLPFQADPARPITAPPTLRRFI